MGEERRRRRDTLRRTLRQAVRLGSRLTLGISTAKGTSCFTLYTILVDYWQAFTVTFTLPSLDSWHGKATLHFTLEAREEN